VRSMTTGRRCKANKHRNTSCVFSSFLYALVRMIFFRRFINTRGHNGVAEHGPDGSYLAAITGSGDVRFGLDLMLLIGKPY